MPRIAALLAALLLVLAPAPALGDDQPLGPGNAPGGGGGAPFGPVPTPEPTIEPAPGTDEVSRTTLYLIALGVLVGVVAIGFVIARDARKSLPRDERDEAPERPEPAPGTVSREARARARKQRSRARIARESRKKNRPR